MILGAKLYLALVGSDGLVGNDRSIHNSRRARTLANNNHPMNVPGKPPESLNNLQVPRARNVLDMQLMQRYITPNRRIHIPITPEILISLEAI